ncbi:hypothetical protein EXIGLDRAFT_777585 [Exidia glandulosa HHB12029]|uniref:F-box domain-containing protein n=1 Tax=Exidia glandulosa HHB12029 TaxID=1314781 RepID=A0A165CYA1_EXIGL|nr:hypothetical protein EXIGLDRAFT_777585 [Exidia glandulosa HHB12029]
MPEPAPEVNPNLPATGAGIAVVLERVAAQERKIAAAGVAVAEAKLQLKEADAVFAEAQARHRAALDVYDAARRLYWKDQEAHRTVESAVTSAQKLLDAALREMDVVRAPLHSSRRTPLEVLGLIFEFCVDLDLSQQSPPDFRRQPFLLARVCSRWRRVALLHPRVWANIDISLDRIKSKNVPASRKYLSNMFTRAGKAAVKLRFSRCRESRSYDTPVVKILLPELRRCHSLHIDIHLCKNDTALPLLYAEFPALRQLRFDVQTDNPDIVDLTRLLPHTPVLCDLSGQYPFQDRTPHIPQLVTASLKYCSLMSVCNLLGIAPCLHTLRLESTRTPMRSSFPSLNDYVSRVETLTIMCDYARTTTLVDFARCARFTAVKSLSLIGRHEGAEARMEFFAHVAEHMGSTLTRLHVGLSHKVAQSLHLLLAALPLCSELSSFKLDAHFMAQSELSAVCEFLGSPSEDTSGIWVCPKLQTIDLDECRFSNCQPEAAIAVLLERRLEAANNDAIPVSLRLSGITNLVRPQTASRELCETIRRLLAPKAE